ncbi:Rv2175c family DNA-binding protein [Microbacterium sp. RU33B]|uniref:Rv2175c family DNA-binding protein n=1 Tax=Microbacterium sp. RU33B TaxID=1907390 RepID=UPI0021170545|nr:Rv2175c family DNA-binding protein [Microbacterium sp. RU33B]
MTSDATPPIEAEWLTLPDLVDLLGEPLSRVRRLLDEGQLLGSRRSGALRVPALFLLGGQPLGSLRGTVTVLHDAGFTDDEAIDWLLADVESLGYPPIEALRAGRKTEVRRVAQSLA